MYRKQPVSKADRQTEKKGIGRQKGRQSVRSQTIIQTNRQNAPRPKIGTIAHKLAGRRKKRQKRATVDDYYLEMIIIKKDKVKKN